MQMRGGLRMREITVDHRRRRGGESKVSGNLVAGLKAAWIIAIAFVRLTLALHETKHGSHGARGVEL